MRKNPEQVQTVPTTISGKGKYKPEHYPRLVFLKAFIGSMGLNTKSLAPIIGKTGAAIGSWFLKDDVSLTNILNIFEKLPLAPGHERHKYRFTVNFRLKEDKSLVDYSEYVGQDGKPSPLMFLWGAIRRSGLTKKEVADRMGVPYSKLRWWKESEDVNISELYALAAALNASLLFVIEPVEEPNTDEQGVEFHIKLGSCQRIIFEEE